MTRQRATLPDLISRLVRQDVVSMHAYAVQDSAGLIKLDAMENPHRLPPHLQEQLGQRLGAVALNRYPGAQGPGPARRADGLSRRFPMALT